MKPILRLSFIFFLLEFYANLCPGQIYKRENQNDTLHSKTLDSIIINKWITPTKTFYIADIADSKIYSGKKTNALLFSDQIEGLPLNLVRTALAKIPGLNIWEMDGAGTQLNIGTRGTDAHRSIEMNMRQNGYNTNSDLFGYPENHYSVPLQAVQEVQLVRGSAALQFGPQFGGMMNFKLKSADTTRPIAVESEQTAGSNNFFNSYNAISGTKGRYSYYAFYDHRSGDGWRGNSKFNYNSFYINLGYRLSSNANISLQFSRMKYVQQIAGGLTDKQFNSDAKKSYRSRNFFEPEINIPAIKFNYAISKAMHLEIVANALFGQRNSVQFINPADIPDTFNIALGSFNLRQIDRDYYNAFTIEARLLHMYKIGKVNSVVSGGIRYFNEVTKRRQKGTGTDGNNFDLSLTHQYGIDLQLTTYNYAVFAENIFQLTKKFSVTPGVRLEVIDSRLNGVINNASDRVEYKSNRNFPLFGAGLQYLASSETQIYGNISQAYRPYLYANITPADRVDKIDPRLKDSKGYDIDIGYRGSVQNILKFDINYFYLFYGHKVGLISQTNPDGSTYLFTTNIGNSVAKGAEVFAEVSALRLINKKNKTIDIKIFNSLAYNNARYISGSINKAGNNITIKGNFVENSPVWIYKMGIEFSNTKFSTKMQYSYNSKSYNDAFNTITSANGIIGMIPAWNVWDWGCNWKIAKQYHISAGINNFTDEKYFNRRITFYPGPGILPADGRTFYISFGVKI